MLFELAEELFKIFHFMKLVIFLQSPQLGIAVFAFGLVAIAGDLLHVLVFDEQIFLAQECIAVGRIVEESLFAFHHHAIKRQPPMLIALGQELGKIDPAPLYDAGFNLVWFVALVALRDHPRLQDGNLLKLAVAGYAVFRFFVEL